MISIQHILFKLLIVEINLRFLAAEPPGRFLKKILCLIDWEIQWSGVTIDYATWRGLDVFDLFNKMD